MRMATTKDSQQSDISALSHVEENATSANENSQPLVNELPRSRFFVRRPQQCCPSSKAALLIVSWNLITVVGFGTLFDPTFFGYTAEGDTQSTIIIVGSSYLALALILLFYPLAGCLADICWGRYKTVINGLWVLLWSPVFGIVLTGVAALGFIPAMIKSQTPEFQDIFPWNNVQIATLRLAVFCVWFGIPIFIAIILVLCGYVTFKANAIQFGTDQLRDASTEDSTLFIHWYVRASYADL